MSSVSAFFFETPTQVLKKFNFAQTWAERERSIVCALRESKGH
jgi:hypothetical protein